ncbi:protein LATE ELONGATED HYPOCOTYL-like [Rutidosis leptorrhynchoides]|uniref:protein LATE ELONGATED HYPOCOTYL-like n=1 Tax=Rutidosis leptorrhynchoides TaxID=125765 RepID=UPI003A99DC74
MDSYSYSSGDKINIKTRKPYTITKQRERWTEDEHNSFLEALKLYGRAWQRIEEHIGTKTAVQIRSHAQKFFTKLEKEAVAKGVPLKQTLDIEIPPPRPKRKPNYPYPRKTDNSQVAADKDVVKEPTLVSSLQSGIKKLDLEKKPHSETTNGKEKLENINTNDEVGNGTDTPSDYETSIPRITAESVNPKVFREFIPTLEKEAINHDEIDETYITIETRKDQKLDQDDISHTNNTSNDSSFEPHENIIQSQYSAKLSLSINDTRCVQNCPRHVPVQVVDVNLKTSTKLNVPLESSTLNNPGEVDEHVNIATASATSGHHNNNASTSSSYPTFNPLFTPYTTNQENSQSFLHASSTISSLIVSSLLQNPAAHAAATFAAKFWHQTNTQAFSGDIENPSMAAIAAATVAAATAWWAAEGLLPVCTPFYPGYSYTYPYPPINGNQTVVANNEIEKGPELVKEKMDAVKSNDHVSSSSSEEESDNQGDVKLNDESSPVDDDVNETNMPVAAEVQDLNKTSGQKQVDRSSCGSNTTSSSEIETDALEKHVKDKDDTKGSDLNLPYNDSISRRSRATFTPNDSWKEVSEEGRLAFQALFSREVLPQSFSKDQQNIVKSTEAVSQLDLNMMSCSGQESGSFTVSRGEKTLGDEGLLRMGLGNVKLNVHHTGFKPYKRCSIEAKESKMVNGSTTGSQHNDEKSAKRMRLETEAST